MSVSICTVIVYSTASNSKLLLLVVSQLSGGSRLEPSTNAQSSSLCEGTVHLVLQLLVFVFFDGAVFFSLQLTGVISSRAFLIFIFRISSSQLVLSAGVVLTEGVPTVLSTGVVLTEGVPAVLSTGVVLIESVPTVLSARVVLTTVCTSGASSLSLWDKLAFRNRNNWK